jgi:hypothetical protein
MAPIYSTPVRRRTRFCSSCRDIARTARLKGQPGRDARQHLNASRVFRSCSASLIVGRHSLAGRAMKNLLRRISETPRAVERAKFERRHPLRLRARATPVAQTLAAAGVGSPSSSAIRATRCSLARTLGERSSSLVGRFLLPTAACSLMLCARRRSSLCLILCG